MNNELNKEPEQLTTANWMYGLYTCAFGNEKNLHSVPKYKGLMYIAIDTHSIFAFLGDGPDKYFGWTKLTGYGSETITGISVKTDGLSVIGDGNKVPLSARTTIPDYDINIAYKEGAIVYATFNDISGIYRNTLTSEKLWEKIEQIELKANVSTVIPPKTYFYTYAIPAADPNGLTNGIYYNMSDAAIAIILHDNKTDDIKDHIDHGRLIKVNPQEWQPDTPYTVNTQVIVNHRFEDFYKCISTHRYGTSVFHKNGNGDTLRWKLLADITLGTSREQSIPIGSMVMWVGDDIPDGYLRCDGSSLYKRDVDAYGNPQSGYPLLYKIIGDKYGGDTNRFNLPIADNMIIKAKV